MFLETLYCFPPAISLNRNACQQLAHEEGHYQFSISLKKYFGLSFEKSLFPDQRVLYLTKLPKPIWLLMVRTQTPDYTESGPSASVPSVEEQTVPLAGAASHVFSTARKRHLWHSLLSWLLLFLAL